MTEITHLNTELINSLHDKFTSELQNKLSRELKMEL